MGLAIHVGTHCQSQRIRVYLHHAIHRRPAFIQRFDALQIFGGNLSRRVFPGRHAVLQLRNGYFLQLKFG